jgi:hypothetical protein
VSQPATTAPADAVLLPIGPGPWSAQRVAQQPGVLSRLARTATFGHRDDLSDLAPGATPRDAFDGYS